MVDDMRTRGHSLKIVLPRCDLELKQRFFHIPVIQRWNALPEYVVTQASLSSFKRKLEVEIEGILYTVLQFFCDNFYFCLSFGLFLLCFASSIRTICNVRFFWLFQLYMYCCLSLPVYICTQFVLLSLFFFCELLFSLLYYGCPLCAFLPAALVVFALLFAIAGAQWRTASADCTTACSAAGVAEASKVRKVRYIQFKT